MFLQHRRPAVRMTEFPTSAPTAANTTRPSPASTGASDGHTADAPEDVPGDVPGDALRKVPGNAPSGPAERIRATIEADGHSVYEELANAIVHGVAAVLAGAALALVVVLAAFTGDAKAVVACAVYGTCMFLVFLSSTLFHGVWHPKAKQVFLAMDHCAIFLAIAGTYTPVALVVFPETSGWVLFGVIWGLALTGIAVRLIVGDLHWSLIPLFLVMGWLAFAWGSDLYDNLDPGGVWLLIAGGLCYSGGIVFYLWRGLRFGHAIWHFFVLAGSITHFVAITAYALEMPS